MATANFRMINGLSYIYILKDEDIYSIDEEGKIDYNLLEEHYLTEIKASLKELNSSLEYHNLILLDGYYGGLQVYLEEKNNLGDYEGITQYEILRDRRIAIYFMEIIALRHNFKKIKLVAQASNGEAFYEYFK